MYIKIDLLDPIISYNPTYASNKVHKCINKQSQNILFYRFSSRHHNSECAGKNSRGKYMYSDA